jgi:hypothetical protein
MCGSNTKGPHFGGGGGRGFSTRSMCAMFALNKSGIGYQDKSRQQRRPLLITTGNPTCCRGCHQTSPNKHPDLLQTLTFFTQCALLLHSLIEMGDVCCCCCCCLQLMKDPVRGCDGVAYERDAIEVGAHRLFRLNQPCVWPLAVPLLCCMFWHALLRKESRPESREGSGDGCQRRGSGGRLACSWSTLAWYAMRQWC